MTTLVQLRLVLDRLSRALTLIGAYALLAATLLVVIEVFERKFGTSTVQGADELSGYALAISTSWSFAYAFYRGSHIRIDALYRFLPIAWRAWLDLFAALALFGLAVILTYWGALEFADSFRFGAVANTVLRTPTWIPELPWVSGLLLFAVATGLTLIECVLRLAMGDAATVHRLIGDPSIAERLE